MQFIPKKVRYKKFQKKSNNNKICGVFLINKMKYGCIGLEARVSSILKSSHLVCIKTTISKIIKRVGLLRILVYPHLSVTKKPVEVRMGKGKGVVKDWIFKLKAGTIICQIETEYLSSGVAALRAAQYKLPFKTRIVKNLI